MSAGRWTARCALTEGLWRQAGPVAVRRRAARPSVVRTADAILLSRDQHRSDHAMMGDEEWIASPIDLVDGRGQTPPEIGHADHKRSDRHPILPLQSPAPPNVVSLAGMATQRHVRPAGRGSQSLERGGRVLRGCVRSSVRFSTACVRSNVRRQIAYTPTLRRTTRQRDERSGAWGSGPAARCVRRLSPGTRPVPRRVSPWAWRRRCGTWPRRPRTRGRSGCS